MAMMASDDGGWMDSTVCGFVCGCCSCASAAADPGAALAALIRFGSSLAAPAVGALWMQLERRRLTASTADSDNHM